MQRRLTTLKAALDLDVDADLVTADDAWSGLDADRQAPVAPSVGA